MYEKQINDLKKQITRHKRSVEKGKADIKFKTIAIVTIMSVLTMLGVTIGAAVNHPILVGILGFSLASMASAQIYEKGIKVSKMYMEGAQNKINECNRLIKQYQLEEDMALGKVVDMPKKEDYSFKREKRNVSANEMENMIDMFNKLNEENHKKRK